MASGACFGKDRVYVLLQENKNTTNINRRYSCLKVSVFKMCDEDNWTKGEPRKLINSTQHYVLDSLFAPLVF